MQKTFHSLPLIYVHEQNRLSPIMCMDVSLLLQLVIHSLLTNHVDLGHLTKWAAI